MEYARLSPDQARQLIERKLIEVEAEHFRITMDMDLAHKSGVDRDPSAMDQMAAAAMQCAQLETQQQELLSRLEQGIPSNPPSNGDEAPDAHLRIAAEPK
jgi:hypothetical protein